MDLKQNLLSIRRHAGDSDKVLQHQAKKEAFWKESRQKAIIEKDLISRQTMIVLENFKARLLNTSSALIESNNAFSKFLEDFDKREKKLQDVWVAINRYNPLLESNFIREQKQLLCTGKRTHQSNVDDEVILPVDLACQLGNILNSKLQQQKQQYSPPKSFSPLHRSSESRFISPDVDLIQMPASQRDLQSDPLVDHKTVMYLFHIFGLIYSRIMDEVDLTEQQSQSIEQIFTDLGVRQPDLVAPPYPYQDDCRNGEQDDDALSSISSKVKLIIQSIETKIGSKEKGKKKTLADIPVNSMASSPRLTLASADENKPFSYHEGGAATANRKRPRKIPLQSSQDKENAFPLFADSASVTTDRRPLSSPPLTPTIATTSNHSESKLKSAAKRLKDTTTSSATATTKIGLSWQEATTVSEEVMYTIVETRPATGESQSGELQCPKDSIRGTEQENDALREELIFLHMESEQLRARNETLESTAEQLQEFRLQQQHKARALRSDLLAAKRYIRQLEERVKERDSEIMSARKSVSDSAFGCMDDIYQVDEVFESYSIPRDRLRNANALISYSKNNLFPSPVKYFEYDYDNGDNGDGATGVVCSPTPEKEEVARQLLEVINVAELQLVEIANQKSAIQLLASENEILRTECATSSQRLTTLESESEELKEQIFEVLQIAEDQAEKLRAMKSGPTVLSLSHTGIQDLPHLSTSTVVEVATDSAAADRLTSNICVECAMMSSIRIAHLESEKDRLQQQILEVLQIAEFQAEKLRSFQHSSSPPSSAISSCSAMSLINRSDDGGDDGIEVMVGNSDSDSDTDGVFTALFDESIDRSEWGEVPVQPDLNASRFSLTAACIATCSPERNGRGQLSLEGQRFLVQEKVDYLLLLFESSLRNALLRFDIHEAADATDEMNLLRCKLQEVLLPCRSEENTMTTTLSTLSDNNSSPSTDAKEVRASMVLLKTEITHLRSMLKAFQFDFESSNDLSSDSSPIQLSEDEDSEVVGSSEILAIMSEVRETLTAKLTGFHSLRASCAALQQEKAMMNKKLSLIAASVVVERDSFAGQLSAAQNLLEEMRGVYESQQKSLHVELQVVSARLLTSINEKEVCEQAMKQEIDALHLELTSTARLSAAFQREAEAQRERCEHVSREYANYVLSLKEEIKLLKEELESTSLESERAVYALKAEKKVLLDKTARMASSRQEERAQLLSALVDERERSAVLLESSKKDVFEARQAYDTLAQYILNSQISELKLRIEITHSETSQVVNSLRLEADQLKELLNTTKATSMHTIDILKREISSWREQLASSTQESNKIIGVLKEEARKVKLQKETMIEESTAIISNLQRELTELVEDIYTLKTDTEADIVVLKEKRSSHDQHKLQMISALEAEKAKVKQEMDEEQRLFVVAVALLQEEVHQLHLVNERDDLGDRGTELRRRLHELQDDVRRWRLGLGDCSDSAVVSAVEVMKATHKELEEYRTSLESTRLQLKSAGQAFDEKVALCSLQSERIAMQEADIETLKDNIAALAVARTLEISRLLERIAALERDLVDQKEQETERYNTYAEDFARQLSAQEKSAEEKLLAAVQDSRVDVLEKAMYVLSEEYGSFRKRAAEIDSEQVDRIACQVQEIEQLRLDYSTINQKYAEQTIALQQVVERLHAREEELSKITVQYYTSKEVPRATPTTITRPQYDIRKIQANVESRPALPTTQFIRNKEKPSSSTSTTTSPGGGGGVDSPEHSFS